MNDSSRLNILVTGSASGIGQAVAALFAAEEHRVFGIDREPASLDPQPGVEHRQADVSNHDEIHAAIAGLGVPRLHVVCINAGVLPHEANLDDATVDDLERTVRVNLLGSLFTAQAAIPLLVAGSSIILTSSTSGLAAHPSAAAYSATKMAQLGLMRSLAGELAPRGIRVNAVCPGGVDTPLVRRLYSAEMLAESKSQNPLGRLADPMDVAHAIAFLASTQARHINAVALRIDGGEAMRGAL